MPGIPLQDLWDDISPINSQAKERLGYPTQKPKVLLERIIQASSNEGDTVLDGFCGCGTTVDAAEALHRNWIGIDISPIAISLIKRRLKDTYGKSLNSFESSTKPPSTHCRRIVVSSGLNSSNSRLILFTAPRYLLRVLK